MITSCIHPSAKEVINCLDPVARHHDLVRDVVFLQRAQGQRGVVRVVFDQQNHFFSCTWTSSSERVNEKVAPLPMAPSAQVLCPWRLIIRRTEARPIPVPGNSVV